ncbi:hypothetical protein [Tsukamurella sp. 1534]|uniref:hypothetical protein n=1 Tax=Tsukamurella sp. 1534 TaxID=1151061 RepID=UPI0011D1BAF0|nr:hypothetical protein [Tsukamurella sp. 1534]
MTKMKKLIGSALLGATVLGGVASVGAGAASADPGRPAQPGVVQHDDRNKQAPGQAQRPAQKAKPQANGQNPDWRPGPVYRQGQWHTPIWDAGKNHWGFWLGPVWIPVG